MDSNNYYLFESFRKAKKVIASCTTPAHCEGAQRYLDRLYTSYYEVDEKLITIMFSEVQFLLDQKLSSLS